MTGPIPTIDIAQARADFEKVHIHSVLWADRALWFEAYAEPLLTALEQMRASLKECADDLEAEIEARRLGELPRRIERDLETVRKARALIAAMGV